MKIQIDPVEAPAVRSLLQQTMNTLRYDKTRKSRYSDPAFLCSFPEDPKFTVVEEPFMPLFSRKQESGLTSMPSTVIPLSDLKGLIENESAPLKPVEVIDSDEDIPRQNLVLIDGWGKSQFAIDRYLGQLLYGNIETIKSSLPSSSTSGSGDEVDQLSDLKLPSSPNTTPPRVFEIENTKMGK